MGEKRCVFCDIFRERINIILETSQYFMNYCEFPVSPGHLLIVPKRHIESVLDLDFNEWSGLRVALELSTGRISRSDLKTVYEQFLKNPLNEASKILCERALKSPYLKGPFRDFNVGINDGRNAGRTVDHLHIHIIPRYEGDVPDPVGGVRHIIPGLGNYKNLKL
jgi:histidine triad (HIT) family protein